MNSTNKSKERSQDVSDTEENIDQNEDEYEYESQHNCLNEMYNDEYEVEDESEHDELNSFDPFDSNLLRDNREKHDGIIFSQEADDFFENEDQEEDNEDDEDMLNNEEEMDDESGDVFPRNDFRQTHPFQPHQIQRQQFTQPSVNQRGRLQSSITAPLTSSGPVMSQLENRFFFQQHTNASPSQYSQQRQSAFNASLLPNSLSAKTNTTSDSDCIMLISSDEEVEVNEIKETRAAVPASVSPASVATVKVDAVSSTVNSESSGLAVDEQTTQNHKLETYFPALDEESEVVVLETRRALEDRMAQLLPNPSASGEAVMTQALSRFRSLTSFRLEQRKAHLTEKSSSDKIVSTLMKALAKAELEIEDLKVRLVTPQTTSTFSEHNLAKPSSSVNTISNNNTRVSSSASLANSTDSSDSFNVSTHSVDFRDTNLLVSEDVENEKKDSSEIQRLVSLVTSLTQSNLRLTKELEEKSKKNTVSTYHSPIDREHESLSDMKSQNLRLQATIHVQQKAQEVLQRKNAELLERISKQAVLYEQVSDFQRKQMFFSSLENELAFAKAKVVSLENNLQAWIQETRKLIALDTCQDLEDSSKITITPSDKLGVTASDLSRAFHVLRDNLASATISNDMLNSQMRVLESRFQIMRQDKEALQQQVQSLTLEKTKLENECKDLQKTLVSNATEIATLNELIDTERDYFSDLRTQKKQKMTVMDDEKKNLNDPLSSLIDRSPPKSPDLSKDDVSATIPEQEQVQPTTFFEFANVAEQTSGETRSVFGGSSGTSLFPFSQTSKPSSALATSDWMNFGLAREKEKESNSTLFSGFSFLPSTSSQLQVQSHFADSQVADPLSRTSLEFTPSSFGFTFGK